MARVHCARKPQPGLLVIRVGRHRHRQQLTRVQSIPALSAAMPREVRSSGICLFQTCQVCHHTFFPSQKRFQSPPEVSSATSAYRLAVQLPNSIIKTTQMTERASDFSR